MATVTHIQGTLPCCPWTLGSGPEQDFVLPPTSHPFYFLPFASFLPLYTASDLCGPYSLHSIRQISNGLLCTCARVHPCVPRHSSTHVNPLYSFPAHSKSKLLFTWGPLAACPPHVHLMPHIGLQPPAALFPVSSPSSLLCSRTLGIFLQVSRSSSIPAFVQTQPHQAGLSWSLHGMLELLLHHPDPAMFNHVEAERLLSPSGGKRGLCFAGCIVPRAYKKSDIE